MKRFKSVDELLDFAITREEAAAAFYAELAGKMEKPWIAQVFKDFSEEEIAHKNKLMGIKSGKLLAPAEEKIQDLQVAEVKENITIGATLDYPQALIVAMKREKAAFKLYSDLAQQTDNAKLKEIFSMLAQEEAKHKLRFELEYDDEVNKEN